MNIQKLNIQERGDYGKTAAGIKIQQGNYKI